MNFLKLKLLKTANNKYWRDIYEIDQEYFIFNNKKFKVKHSLSNLSRYLNTINKNIIELFNIQHKCKECGTSTKIFFSRNKLTVYHFCSVKCQKKYKKDNTVNICSICGNEFLTKDKRHEYYGTCGNTECIIIKKQARRNAIKKFHWRKTDCANEIETKRVETRLNNDKLLNRKYIAWNKGKTGIYSKETIEKIRSATIKQLQDRKIKKTKIEKRIEEFLKEQNINYVYSFILKQRQYDFYLKDYNILIEADGDYWHGNPLRYKELTERQQLKQLDDKIKNRIANENGYTIIRFWENDIYKNFETVKIKIIETINEKKLF